MEFDWYCTGWLLWSIKAAGEFFGFQKATSELSGKAKKSTACHLMPYNKHLGKQICNRQFRNHKIFKPCKTRSVNFCPSALSMCNCIKFYIVICCWFIIRYYICFFAFIIDQSALLFRICSAFCCAVHSIIPYSITECYFCPDTGNVF